MKIPGESMESKANGAVKTLRRKSPGEANPGENQEPHPIEIEGISSGKGGGTTKKYRRRDGPSRNRGIIQKSVVKRMRVLVSLVPKERAAID